VYKRQIKVIEMYVPLGRANEGATSSHVFVKVRTSSL